MDEYPIRDDDMLHDPRFVEWAQRVDRELKPMILDSSVVVSIYPSTGVSDVKFAVELGFAITLDKPIVVVKSPGQTISRKMAAIADVVVVGDMSTDEGRHALTEGITEALSQLHEEGLLDDHGPG